MQIGLVLPRSLDAGGAWRGGSARVQRAHYVAPGWARAARGPAILYFFKDAAMESNPVAAGAVSYTQELIALLGARDPLEVQAGLAARLRQAVEDLDGAVLRTPEAPGKWSVIEVLRHLADTELVYGYRMRMVVAQPGSPLAAYDQELWAESLRYREADLGSTLEEIERLRAANLSWLHGLSGEEMDRVGIHEERGEESVRTIVALLAAHDLVHLRQIERIKAALSGA